MTTRLSALFVTSLLATVGPVVSQAQDAHAPRDSQASHATQVQSEAEREGRANDRNGNDPSLNNDQSPRRDDGHGADDRVADLHRTHPQAAARCHDGFFTMTRDRGRACTRHGGIDVWLTG